jgi:hypothetical protein
MVSLSIVLVWIILWVSTLWSSIWSFVVTSSQAFPILLTIKRYQFFSFDPLKFNFWHSGGFKARRFWYRKHDIHNASFGTEFSFASKASTLAIFAATALAFGKPCFLNWNRVYCSVFEVSTVFITIRMKFFFNFVFICDGVLSLNLFDACMTEVVL